MKKERQLEKIVLILFVAALAVVLLPKNSFFSTPDATVNYYFQSWNEKNWEGMYSAISDGFKKTEPTASNLTNFENLLKSANVNSVQVHLVNVTSNNGTYAIVRFEVTYDINGTAATSRSDFLLRYRQNDAVPGWKLIQPYGNKADES